MTELRAVVHGMVQGVWFRGWTCDAARELGLSGWVRNRRDGAVELAARGGREALERFLARLHEGPPLARVSRVDAQWAEVDEAPGSGRFLVRH
ncbi:acylphosphatase [Pseudodesulfovibrio sp.]|uniref:acylphosphatase n=1 Tax=Pseudodesulfovibrio sp. TaxID=2035812 RepID=UPI00261E5EA3|nr:acylphosphatase [Pseudodesulfovibrio sp.]MDD3311725.1 acylphosphatase [Pseudodesulfovibrio sp.]